MLKKFIVLIILVSIVGAFILPTGIVKIIKPQNIESVQKYSLIFPLDVRDCRVNKRGQLELTGWFNQQRWYGLHRAYDVAVVEDTPVYMPADGVVTKVYSYNYPRKINGKWQAGYGIYLEVEFDYEGQSLSMLFAHLNRVLVREGDIVAQGDTIALTGSTGLVDTAGRYYYAPHLHFEVIKDGKKIPFTKELGEAVRRDLGNKNPYIFTLRK